MTCPQCAAAVGRRPAAAASTGRRGFAFDIDFLLFYSKHMPNEPHTALPSPLPSGPLARRLKNLSRAVQGLSLLAMPVLVAVPVLLLLSPETLLSLGRDPVAGTNLLHLAHGPLTLAMRTRMAAVSGLTVATGLWLLWHLWRLFGEYRQGAVFSPRALASLRRFAWGMLALALVQPLSGALMSVAVSWDNPPGQRLVMVALSSNDYALLLGALVFLAIARVMTEAARVAEENEGFV